MIHTYVRMIYYMALKNAHHMSKKDPWAYDKYYEVVDAFYYDTFSKPASFVVWALENIGDKTH